MEPKSQTVFTNEPTTDTGKGKKKSGGAGKFFRVALFMLRRRSKTSKGPVDMGSDKGVWRRLLGSMRPLHIQGNESTQAAPGAAVSSTSKTKEDFEELPSPSPSPSFSPASRSSSFSTSQYASATNLQELDESSDEDEEAMGDDTGGDEMIDAKAEEFIAQFYEQMRRQRYNAY